MFNVTPTEWVDISGLVLDMIGAFLLFRFGLQEPIK
jgi:hypothetical protein